MGSINQQKPGFFKRHLVDAPLACMHLIYNLSRVYNILESIEGRDGIVIHKVDGEGFGWTIGGSNHSDGDTNPDSGTPTGFEEKTDVPVAWKWDSSSCKWQCKTATILVKTGTLSETWLDGLTFVKFDA